MSSSYNGTPFDHDTLIVADSAVGLTPTTPGSARYAEMTLESGQIRMWSDGTDPTTSEGMIVNVGDDIILYSQKQVEGFRAIRTGSTSGKLQIQYFH